MLTTDLAGHAVDFDIEDVAGLAPDVDPENTILILRDRSVTVQLRYERLIEELAAMWPRYAL